MSDKIARLGIERDSDKMYYVKNGDVWATPRKQPGRPKGKPTKVASTGLDLDYSKYIYYVDGDGDVARKERGGGRRKSKASKAATPAPSTRGALSGKKSQAQIAREIAECLAKVKMAGYEVSDEPVGAKRRGGKRA
jgi:hypothetical protein